MYYLLTAQNRLATAPTRNSSAKFLHSPSSAEYRLKWKEGAEKERVVAVEEKEKDRISDLEAREGEEARWRPGAVP